MRGSVAVKWEPSDWMGQMEWVRVAVLNVTTDELLSELSIVSVKGNSRAAEEGESRYASFHPALRQVDSDLALTE